MANSPPEVILIFPSFNSCEFHNIHKGLSFFPTSVFNFLIKYIFLHKRIMLKTLKVLRPPPVCIVVRFHWDKYINHFEL